MKQAARPYEGINYANTHNGNIYHGIVIDSIPGTYSVNVFISAVSAVLPCIVSLESSSSTLGAISCALPCELTRVLVYVPNSNSEQGILLGTLAVPAGDSKAEENDGLLTTHDDTGITCADVEAYNNTVQAFGPSEYNQSNNGRPTDILPGEWAVVNTFGGRIALHTLSTNLSSTPRSKVETNFIDDLVRITAGTRHDINASGEIVTYDDNGELSTVAYTDFYKEDLPKPDGEETEQASKRRLQSITGAVTGGILQTLSANDTAIEDVNTDRNASGTYSSFIGFNGQQVVSSAAGLSYRLNTSIVVPHNKRQPWDPEGDKIKDITREKIEAPKIDKEYIYGRNLVVNDVDAVVNKGTYQRMDETKEDWFVPEEEDVKRLTNTTDKYNSEFEYQQGRKAGIDINEDGSIHLWDTFGSEIFMRGGNIVIAAPGDIMLQAGGNVVSMSKDNIIKARDSVDITTEKQDVRIKAEGNMQLHSRTKGILLHAEATGSGSFDDKGEACQSKGIILKSADNILVKCSKITTICGDLFTKAKSSIINIAKRLTHTAEGTATLSAGSGASFVHMSPTSSAIGGPSVVVAGASGANIMKGSKVLIPLQWGDSDSDIYGQYSSISKDQHETFSEDDAVAPYTDEYIEKVKFAYRSSKEYGTDKATETYDGKEFVLYQPRWQLLADGRYRFLNGNCKTWAEEAIEETYPWPGKDSRDNCFVKVRDLKNVDPTTLKSKARQNVSNDIAYFTKESIDNYAVIE